MPGTNVKLTFNGFGGYYGPLSEYNGYQGFDFDDINYFTKAGIDHQYPRENAGYNNDLHGSGEAYTHAADLFPYGYGAFFAPAGETFSVKSGTFASAWDAALSVYFIAYNGKHQKADVKFTLNCYTPTTIDFAKYGGDFKNITRLGIYSNNVGLEKSHYRSGYQVVIDNLKAVWKGAVPGADHTHPHIAHPLAGWLGHHDHESLTAAGSGRHGMSGGFHSALTSLDGALGHHEGGGLTAEFALPFTDHFGT